MPAPFCIVKAGFRSIYSRQGIDFLARMYYYSSKNSYYLQMKFRAPLAHRKWFFG